MKKNIFGLSLCAIALSGLMMVSCETETVYEVANVPSLAVSAAMTVSYDGGNYSCTYTLSNPEENGLLTCSADVSWISDVTDNGSSVSFTVDANTSDELRNGNIKISYTYTNGYIEKTVGVIQYAYETPILTVQPTAVTAANDGGTYSFTYDVENAVDGGEVTCTTDASWVSGFDYSTYGEVSFTVAANSNEELRDCEITVTYSYDSGKSSVSKTVAVVQDRYVVTPPAITVQPTTVPAEYSGGTCSFTYSVRNPADDGQISCSTDADWVSGFDYSTDGTVSFTVSANEGVGSRDCKITVTYTYDSNSSFVSKSVTVVQHCDVSKYVGTYTAHGTVYGNGITVLTEKDWTVKIYANDYSMYNYEYDLYYDGVIPWGEGAYDTYNDHRASAGVYVYTDGTLHMPSQIANATLSTTSGGSYYLGYTPCTKYEDGSYYYGTNFPDLTFTYNDSTEQWESDYGIFMCGCTSADISSMATYFQVVIPTITLTRTAETTSAHSNAVTHSIMDGLTFYKNFKAE